MMDDAFEKKSDPNRGESESLSQSVEFGSILAELKDRWLADISEKEQEASSIEDKLRVLVLKSRFAALHYMIGRESAAAEFIEQALSVSDEVPEYDLSRSSMEVSKVFEPLILAGIEREDFKFVNKVIEQFNSFCLEVERKVGVSRGNPIVLWMKIGYFYANQQIDLSSEFVEKFPAVGKTYFYTAAVRGLTEESEPMFAARLVTAAESWLLNLKDLIGENAESYQNLLAICAKYRILAGDFEQALVHTSSISDDLFKGEVYAQLVMASHAEKEEAKRLPSTGELIQKFVSVIGDETLGEALYNFCTYIFVHKEWHMWKEVSRIAELEDAPGLRNVLLSFSAIMRIASGDGENGWEDLKVSVNELGGLGEDDSKTIGHSSALSFQFPVEIMQSALFAIQDSELLMRISELTYMAYTERTSEVSPNTLSRLANKALKAGANGVAEFFEDKVSAGSYSRVNLWKWKLSQMDIEQQAEEVRDTLVDALTATFMLVTKDSHVPFPWGSLDNVKDNWEDPSAWRELSKHVEQYIEVTREEVDYLSALKQITHIGQSLLVIGMRQEAAHLFEIAKIFDSYAGENVSQYFANLTMYSLFEALEGEGPPY